MHSHNPRPLVLNVNDNDGVRYLITRMLDRSGYLVIESTSGTEAIRAIRSERPNLVVLDIRLPDMDGLEVCRQIKADATTRAVKILHTSALFVAPEAKVQSLNSGADGYLTYPFEEEELAATARSLIRLQEAEQRLRDNAEELRAANRRTHEFLAMLAHELRNPLSAITTSLPLLERHAARDDAEELARGVLHRQVKQLRRLVDDLLDVARVTHGKIEPKWESLDLVALLARVTESARRVLTDSRSQHIGIDLPARSVVVRADSLRLEQVFSNLLDNASKYTADRGRISVSLELPDSKRGYARVVIADNGIGIPVRALKTIFDLFSQAEVPIARTRGGIGIGLTVVKSLVELHGGEVSVSSEGVGRGCEVEVLLPVLDVAGAGELVEAGECAVSATATAKRRIVVVEDNLDVQCTLKSLLEVWGHDVAVASDGHAGLETIGAYKPEIALVDIGLPITDGYQLARSVDQLEGRRNLLLVALTGYGAPEQRARALEAGFDMHLVKPVQPEELASLIADPHRYRKSGAVF